MVRHARARPLTRTSPQVVLSHLPPSRLGTASRGRVRPGRRRDRRAHRREGRGREGHPDGRSPNTSPPQTAAEFAELLSDLAVRLDTGRIYDRDLHTIEIAGARLIDALRRRVVSRRRR